MDITQLTLEQMVELQKQLATALPNKKKERIDGLRAEIEARIEEAGMSVEEVLRPLLPNTGVKRVRSGSSGSRKPAAIKYRKDNNTWTGKGKAPAWLVEFEAGGGDRESLRAENTANK